MNIAKVVLIYSFIQVINSLFTIPPTWITSSYVQADSARVIDGDACNCKTANDTTPTGTLTFPTAFAAIPNLGYGISNYQGDDGMAEEMIQVKRISLNTTSFSFSFQISGFTNLWVVQVRYIGISKSFPHHLNSFDNVPVQYNNGALVNISTHSLSVQTYQNTINYTLQAQSIGSSYTTFSMPLSNNKILLFLTSIFIFNGTNDRQGPPFYPLNLQMDAIPTTTSSYTLTVRYSINSAITRLHFSMIIFDQADVQASGQYLLIYDKLCHNQSGGFYPFQSQFLSNFMIGFVEFSTLQSISVIHFETIYGVFTGLYGARMPQSINRITRFVIPSLTRSCFTYFYMKTWSCPNQTFFDPAQDLCTSCPIINCIDCYNLTVCSICNQTAQHFINYTTGQCGPCGIVGCINCSTPMICLSCNNAGLYFLNTTDNLCYFCTIPYCLNCLNLSSCSSCNTTAGYVLNVTTGLCDLCPSGLFINSSSNTCQPCAVNNCSICSALTICSVCDLNSSFYLVNSSCSYCDSQLNYFINYTTGQCGPCGIVGCINCSTPMICLSCNNAGLYFLNTTDNLCYFCTIPYCLNCLNLSSCSSCNTTAGYVLNVTTGLCDLCPSGLFINSSSNTCQPCAVNNCSICSALTICSVCDLNSSFYLVNSSCNYCDPQLDNFISQVTLDCQPCSIPFCINCSSLTSCSDCNITLNYLLNSTDNLCYLCTLAQCIECEKFTTCTFCNTSNGYFLNISSGQCEYCNLSGCILCSTLTTCLICDNQTNYGFDYTSPNMSLCGACNVSCTCDGYGLPWKVQSQTCTPICGYGLIRVNQECDDNNKDTYDGCSNCYVQDYYICAGEPSACNQTLFIEGEFISIQKSGCNEFKIITKTPNLTLSQISNNIFILNKGISIIKTTQINGSFIEIYAQYTRDIVDQSIIFKFSPGNLLNITYQPKTPPIFYTDQECKVQGHVSILLQASQYISYGILLLSLLSCKIVGLELFGVLQLSYFTLASHSFLNIYLQPLTSFKTFNGLNIQLVSQATDLPNNFNKLGVAGLFINNCNIMLCLLFGEFVVSLILFITAKIIHKENLKKIALRLMKQGFITFVIFNIFNISFSAGVHWKYANPNDDGYILSSIILCGTIVAMIVAVFALQLSDKQDYGEFKNKFKQSWTCHIYITLTICYRMVLGFYSAVQADYQESTLLILAFSIAFVMYLMINLPFSSALQNYRCFFIHATMLYTLLTTNYYRAMKSTTPMQIKGRIYTPAIIQLVLIVSCIFISFCVLVYEIYGQLKECYSRKKTSNKDLDQRQNTQQSFENL